MRMKSPPVMMLIAGALWILAPRAGATPSAWYQFNDQRFLISENDWMPGPFGGWMLDFQNEDPGSFRISGEVVCNNLPRICYGISATNFTNTTAMFTFDVDLGFRDINWRNLVYTTYSGSVTDGAGDGVSMQPTGDKMQITDVNGTNVGADVGNGFSAGPGFPGQSYDAGSDYQMRVLEPGHHWTDMNTTLSFTLTGGNDVAEVEGSSEFPRRLGPEPASALLLLPGLIALAVWRRRRV